MLVVEHDEAVMRAADWLIDIGPGAGDRGGQIVAEGTPAEVAAESRIRSPAATCRAGCGSSCPRSAAESAKTRMLELEGATLHNLQERRRARFRSALFTCVTGVSGSGKSSLVIDTLGARAGPQAQRRR